MGPLLIPALLLLGVLVVGFIVWELYFTRGGQKSLVEQHQIEGNDEPPKVI
jgi:hypothetical protein